MLGMMLIQVKHQLDPWICVTPILFPPRGNKEKDIASQTTASSCPYLQIMLLSASLSQGRSAQLCQEKQRGEQLPGPQGNQDWHCRARARRVIQQRRAPSSTSRPARALPVGYRLSQGLFTSLSGLNVVFQVSGASAGTRFHPGPSHEGDAQSPPKGLLQGWWKIPLWDPLGKGGCSTPSQIPLHWGDIQSQICPMGSPAKIWCHQKGWSPPTPFPSQTCLSGPGIHIPNPSPVLGGGCQALGHDELSLSSAPGGLLPYPSPRQGLEIKVGFVGFN